MRLAGCSAPPATSNCTLVRGLQTYAKFTEATDGLNNCQHPKPLVPYAMKLHAFSLERDIAKAIKPMMQTPAIAKASARNTDAVAANRQGADQVRANSASSRAPQSALKNFLSLPHTVHCHLSCNCQSENNWPTLQEVCSQPDRLASLTKPGSAALQK